MAPVEEHWVGAWKWDPGKPFVGATVRGTRHSQIMQLVEHLKRQSDAENNSISCISVSGFKGTGKSYLVDCAAYIYHSNRRSHLRHSIKLVVEVSGRCLQSEGETFDEIWQKAYTSCTGTREELGVKDAIARHLRRYNLVVWQLRIPSCRDNGLAAHRLAKLLKELKEISYRTHMTVLVVLERDDPICFSELYADLGEGAINGFLWCEIDHSLEITGRRPPNRILHHIVAEIQPFSEKEVRDWLRWGGREIDPAAGAWQARPLREKPRSCRKQCIQSILEKAGTHAKLLGSIVDQCNGCMGGEHPPNPADLAGANEVNAAIRDICDAGLIVDKEQFQVYLGHWGLMYNGNPIKSISRELTDTYDTLTDMRTNLGALTECQVLGLYAEYMKCPTGGYLNKEKSITELLRWYCCHPKKRGDLFKHIEGSYRNMGEETVLTLTVGLQFAYWVWNATASPLLTRFNEHIGDALGNIATQAIYRWFEDKVSARGTSATTGTEPDRDPLIQEAVELAKRENWDVAAFGQIAEQQLIRLLRDRRCYGWDELEIFWQDIPIPPEKRAFNDLKTGQCGGSQACVAEEIVLQARRAKWLPVLIGKMSGK